MKKSTKAGLIGAGIFAIGAGVGYAVARVIDCIQVKRMLKVAASRDNLTEADECLCDECECDACDACEDETVVEAVDAEETNE